MATINASSSADIIVPSVDGSTYRGLGGDDTYIVSNAASGSITIVDTSGANKIQLVDGLSIASSKFAADSVQLTLSNGAVITVNGADKFTFDVGGNASAGVSGTAKTYAELASDMGVATLPTGTTISDGGAGTVSGAAISSGAISYSLSAGGTSVAEGGSITYTITASSAPTSDVTFTYNVVGDDNGATVDKATSADLVALSGTVTLSAGSTSTTFDVTANTDEASEGLEGIKVTVFDASLDSIGSTTALISNTASTAAQTKNATTGVDTIQGGEGDDIIGGTISAANATGSTAQPGDVFDGGSGTDILKLSLAGTLTGDHTISGIEVSNIEEIQVNGFQTDDAQDYTLDMALMTGVNTIGLNSSSATNDLTISNVPSIMTVNAKNGGGDLTVTYKAVPVAGAADSQTVNVDGYTGTLSIAGVEYVTVNAGAVKSTLAALTTSKQLSLTLTGDTKTTITGALTNTTAAVDGSATTGGFDVQITPVTATYAVAVTGGSGDDTVNINSDLSKYITFDGGDGTDTLEIDDADDITSTSTVNLTSVEVLQIDSRDATAYNLKHLPTVTAVTANAANGANAATISNMTAANSTVTVTETGTEGIIGTMAIDGASDTLNLTIGTGLAGGSTHTLVSFIDHETINITVPASTDGVTYTLTDMDATDATTITLSGAGKLTFTSLDLATKLSVIDASASTGGLVMGENPATLVGTVITGSVKADTLYGSASATYGDTIKAGGGIDTVYGGAGNDTIWGEDGNDILMGQAGIDTIEGGAGNDTIHVDVVANFEALATAETVDGGAGTDTLNFGAAVAFTVDSTDLYNLKNVEKITFDTSSTATLTLDDTVFTSNGVSTLKIYDLEGTQPLTVTASALSAGNNITVYSKNAASKNDSFTGGAGDDLFVFSTISDADVIDGSDTIAGGKGSDTLYITATTIAGNITITTAVTSVENFTFVGVDSTALTYTLADASIVTSTLQGNNGIVDASGMTGTGALTFSANAENDSGLTITGGRAGDTLTGGNATASAFSGAALFDTIKGGDGADIIDGKAGIDVLHGEGGNDTFTVSTNTDFLALTAAETVDGGAGTDTISFDVDGATTVIAADLAGIKDVEVLKFTGDNTVSLTLSDSVFTANGSSSITVWEEEASQPLTLAAGGLSSANSVKVKINTTTGDADVTEAVTLGAGDDTVTYHSAQRLDTADVIAFGGGTDTLAVYINNTALSATLTNVSSVENITLVQVTTNTATITLADGNFVSTQAGVIDAAATAGVLTLDADAEDDSSLTIKGGTGADIITGTDATLSGSTVLGDTITGGNGADIITGSLGADTLTGGAGADVFSYDTYSDSSGSYVDDITDFLDGTDLISITIDRSSITTAQTITPNVTAGKASKSAAQDTLTGIPGQAIYVTDTGHLYVNHNADNLLTSLDYKIKVNPGATAASTFDATNDDNFKWTVKGGSGIDTITLGPNADKIYSGAGADIITTTSDSAVDTFYIGDSELDATSVANSGNTVDIITGFVVASDVISIDLSEIEGVGSDDLVQMDDFSSVAAGDTIVVQAVSGTFDLVNAAAGTNVLLVQGVTITEGAVETALEANGDRQLTANGGMAQNDAFLAIADDGTNSALFFIVADGGAVADDSAPAANELTAMKLLTFSAVAGAEDFTAADFAITA